MQAIIDNFKMAFRAIRHQKMYTFINIFGLAVGLACGILCLSYQFKDLAIFVCVIIGIWHRFVDRELANGAGGDSKTGGGIEV